jgi:hypothetical protein
VLEHCGGQLGCNPGIVKLVSNKASNLSSSKSDIKYAQDCYLALSFILGSDKAHFGKLIENLENYYLQGNNMYPTTLSAAYTLLTHWKLDSCSIFRVQDPTAAEAVSFVTDGK